MQRIEEMACRAFSQKRSRPWSAAKLSRSWRLLTHPDLRRTPRVAAFFDFIVAEREALKSILTG
jgi:hypothetical protein